MRRTRSREANEGGAKTGTVQLRPLTPGYEPGKHDVYVDALAEAIKADDVRNIALAGRYGAGKSSVVEGLLKRLRKQDPKTAKRTVVLSLSTIDPDNVSSDIGGGDRYGTNHVREESSRTPEHLSLALSKTNRIQKELVKQLLYRESPRSLPHSRFHRIGNRTRLHSAGFGFLSALLVTIVLRLLGWVPELAGTQAGGRQADGVYVFALVLLAAVLGVLHWVTWQKFVVKSLSAGGANIELQPRSVSYFDQHLDEIVYFFDRTKTNLVIFEDLDRFDDHLIFQSLRDLNTQLNNASSRRERRRWWGRDRKARPVRFVYATRDSIFDGVGQGDAMRVPEANQRANRTKFFDVIIPLVPFITPASSRGLLRAELKEAGHPDSVSSDVIALVASEITDLRQLRNISNEFALFHHTLITDGKGVPNLAADEVFALVVLKNLHPGEFEKITRGTSLLGDLYQAIQKIVDHELEELELQRERLYNRTDFTPRVHKQAREAGQALRLHLGGAVPDIVGQHELRWMVTFDRAQPPETFESLCVPDLWQRIAQINERLEFEISKKSGNGWSRVGSAIVTLAQARAITQLDAMDWVEPDPDDVAKQLRNIERRIERLPTLDFHQLLSEGSLDPNATSTLGQQVAEKIDTLLEDLTQVVRDLVREGHIGRDFAANAGESDATLPRSAATFLFQHLKPGRPSASYSFARPDDTDPRAASGAAIDALLEHEGDAFLGKSVAYNHEVLGHLIRSGQDDRAGKLVNRLTLHIEEAEQNFIEEHLRRNISAEGQDEVHHRDTAEGLVRLLAPRWSGVFALLAREHPPTDAEARRLWSTALTAANPDRTYEVADAAPLLLHHHHQLPAFSDAALTATQASAVTAVLNQAGIKLPFIAALKVDNDTFELGDALLSRIIETHAYDISAHNLRRAVQFRQVQGAEPVSNGAALELDVLITVEQVWDYVRLNPEDYVRSLPKGATATRSARTLAWVLKDCEELWSLEQARIVLKATGNHAQFDDLRDAPSKFWPALAARNRFKATTTNLITYVAELGLGELTSELAELLSKQERIEANHDSGAEVETLATLIVGASDVLKDPALRAQLAADTMVGRLSLKNIRAEGGGLLTELRRHGLVEDTPQTLAHFVQHWDAIEKALTTDIGQSDGDGHGDGDETVPAVSTESVNQLLVNPRQFAGNVTPLLGSPAVPQNTKQMVIDQLAQFVPDDGAKLLLAARAARELDLAVPLDQVARVALNSGARFDMVFALLAPHASANVADLKDVVTVMAQHLESSARGQPPVFDVPRAADARKGYQLLERNGLVARPKASKNG